MTNEFKPFHKEVEKIRDSIVGRPEWPPQPRPLTAEDWPTLPDEKRLDEIQDKVYTHLREKKVPATCRNIIHAMFELSYADWLGGQEILPTCPYEDCEANGL